MKMRLRIRPRLIALFIVISLSAEYYYLVDMEAKIGGIIQYSHFALGICVMWGAVISAQMLDKKYPVFQYMAFPAAFVALTVLGAIQANRLYNQGLAIGWFGQYRQIIWAILYYPISEYVFYGKITCDDLRKVLKLVGTIQLIIFISQYFLTDQMVFVHVHEAHRYGEIRYYFSPTLIDLLLFFELDRFLNEHGPRTTWSRISSVCYIIAILFEVMVVQKYRLTTVGLLCCSALGVLIYKGTTMQKLRYFLLAGIGVIILLNTTIVQDIIGEVLFKKTYNGGVSSLRIREIGRAFYIDTFLKHPLLGGGFPQLEFSGAAEASGYTANLYVGDNGIFGFLFMYGGLGILWVVFLWIKMLRNGWKIYKKSGQLTYFLYPLFFVVTCVNEVHWYYMDGFMFLMFFLVLQQNELQSISLSENEKRTRKRMRCVKAAREAEI